MIVAQQFIAGGRLKRRVRPGLSAIVRMTKEGRDDRSTVCAREVALEAKGNGSFVPPGRTPLWAISQHFVLGFIESLRDESSRRISNLLC
jgi:hypothetical protein